MKKTAKNAPAELGYDEIHEFLTEDIAIAVRSMTEVGGQPDPLDVGGALVVIAIHQMLDAAVPIDVAVDTVCASILKESKRWLHARKAKTASSR